MINTLVVKVVRKGAVMKVITLVHQYPWPSCYLPEKEMHDEAGNRVVEQSCTGWLV